MNPRLLIQSAIIVGSLLALLAAGLWILDGAPPASQASPSCATDLTPRCLLDGAKAAARKIEDDHDRRTIYIAILGAYGRAGMAEQALDVLRKPGDGKPGPLSSLLIDVRGHLLDELRAAGDDRGAKMLLEYLGRDLGRLDPHTLFLLARGWIEIGEIDRGLKLIDRGLFQEREKYRACISRRAAARNEILSPCRRASPSSIELKSAAVALFLAGHREEGEKVLGFQETAGWKVLVLRRAVERAIARSDPDLGRWALRRAFDLARSLPEDDRQATHLQEILKHARILNQTDILEAALERYRLLAARLAETEDRIWPLVSLARIEVEAGDRQRARFALRQALEIAGRQPRTPAPGLTSVSKAHWDVLLEGKPGSLRPDILPRNPRREALGSLVAQIGDLGFHEDQRRALALYAEEIDAIEHPLQRAWAFVFVARYTHAHDEPGALAKLSEAKALIESWPEKALQRQVLQEIAPGLIGPFGLRAAEDFLGDSLPQEISDQRRYTRALNALAEGDFTGALDLAGMVRSTWLRFGVAVRVRQRFEALNDRRLPQTEQMALRDRAGDMMAAAVLEAEATKDAYERASHLATMASALAQHGRRSPEQPN